MYSSSFSVTAFPEASLSLDSVILLTGPSGVAELTRFLRLHNPDLAVVHAATREQLMDIPLEIVCRARLIGFATDVVVPKAILDLLGFGAFNFHPGPPSHPGWAPACFAIYDQAPIFGATAHKMTARVDEGPIVGVRLFPLRPDATPTELDIEALAAMAHLLRELGPTLVRGGEPRSLPIEWGAVKRRRADLTAMRDISDDLDEAEKARRTRAFSVALPPENYGKAGRPQENNRQGGAKPIF